MNQQKIAIIYDWMDSWGGVERMLLVLNEMFPQADWYTSYINPDRAEWINKFQMPNYKLQTISNNQYSKIQTSFIQKLPGFIRKNRILSLPFYSYAFESFDLRGYDLVISVTSSFAKGVITHPGTRHICILLTPTRWLWSHLENYKSQAPRNKQIESFIEKFVKHLQKWDYVAAQRPDEIISISQTVADRCLKYYHRQSEVVYPPFDRKYWDNIKDQITSTKKQTISKFQNPSTKYFLVVSRLEPYKKVDVVIEAFNKMPKQQLLIVGSGTQKKTLHKKANQNIRFIGNISDKELGVLYSGAQGLVMPQEEDFGYTALEAQFFGCPVIAYRKGGAKETVINGKTGIFFAKQTVNAIYDAVADFQASKYNLDDNKSHLAKFSKERFVNEIRRIVQIY